MGAAAKGLDEKRAVLLNRLERESILLLRRMCIFCSDLRTFVHLYDFVKLLCVPGIMRGERAKPIVIMQAAKKRMLHPVFSKITRAARLKHSDSSPALLDQARKHDFPIIEQ